MFETTRGPARHANAAALAKLKPVFARQAQRDRRNFADERWRGGGGGDEPREGQRAGLTPIARFVSFAVGWRCPKLIGIGPVVAVPEALKLAQSRHLKRYRSHK